MKEEPINLNNKNINIRFSVWVRIWGDWRRLCKRGRKIDKERDRRINRVRRVLRSILRKLVDYKNR